MRAAEPSELIRRTRRSAGLTQAELAGRAGTTQAAVARAERAGANPTVRTLDRLMAAAGRELVLLASPAPPPVDEEQIRAHLALSPAQRLETFQASHRNLRRLLAQARWVD